ncbi:hypothetical protein JHK84_056088 [Glycine max]|nr:hypothetical protein JHK84_056088 [Glycine max]
MVSVSCIPKTLKPSIPLPMKDGRTLSSYGSVYIPPHQRLRSLANFNNSLSPVRAKLHENPTPAVVTTLQPSFTEQLPDKQRSRFVSSFDDTVSEEGSDREFQPPSLPNASPIDNTDEWKRKFTMLLRDKSKQELVSREKKDRRDFDRIAVLASRMGLYSHMYAKVVVFSKVPLPNYRYDLDDRRPQREVSLSITMYTQVNVYFEEYLGQKSRMNKSFSDLSSARSSSNGSIGTDEGLFELPEPLASSNAYMEKILRQRSLQMRDQQQAWQVTFPQIQNHGINNKAMNQKNNSHVAVPEPKPPNWISKKGETTNKKTWWRRALMRRTGALLVVVLATVFRRKGGFVQRCEGRTRPVPVGPQNRAILRAELILATMESPEGRRMLEFRRSLPAYKKKEAILSVISRNQVVIISGETGCGKTTQIPQFILESEVESVCGAACNIICTQPRRISAMSVSERVASERGEKLGESGFTYPVRTHFLENILEMTGYRLTPYNQIDDYGQERMWKMNKHAPRKRKSQIASAVEDAIMAADFKDYSLQTQESLLCWNPDCIGFSLIEYILCNICENERPGAVLVFMTGWDDISSLKEKLLTHTVLGDANRVLLLTCHGSMASSEQRLIFEEAEDGVRKIVLTTNIAETSITINDVVFVLDCGKAKETSYDALNNTPCLLPTWISKVSAKQRRGRAGRVQPGECYHLYPRCVYDAFAEYQLPEILRTPLQSLCLQIKSLRLGSISEFLSRALQSPETLVVQNAIEYLKIIGALDEDENLTILGRCLTMLPMEPKLGKMLILGAIFNCLDPILTVVAGLSVRDPFLTPLDKRDGEVIRGGRQRMIQREANWNDKHRMERTSDKLFNDVKRDAIADQICNATRNRTVVRGHFSKYRGRQAALRGHGAQRWVTFDISSGQREANRSNHRADRSEQTEAQGIVAEPNHSFIHWKETGERGSALEGKKCSEDSGNEVGSLIPRNFELEPTESRAGVQNVEGDEPLTGLSKSNFSNKNEGVEGNANCEQKGTKHVEKVYSRSRGCRKQMDHGHNVGLSKKSNTNAHKEANSVNENYDKYSPAMRGSGLKEVADWEEMDKVQQATQVPQQNNSHKTCDQIKEATSKWTMVQNLGVTCGKGDASVVTKLLAEEAKSQFCGAYSDHLALVRAYEGWRDAEMDLGGYEYCWKNFLSSQSMKAIDALRREFICLVKDIGLVDSNTASCNEWSSDVNLIRAIICYGLYPGICSVVHNEKSFSLKTMEDGQVLLYSNSVNAQETKIPYPWLVFNEKIKVNSVFLRDSTAVSDSVVLLFGGSLLKGDTDNHLKMLGGYLEFFMEPSVAEMYQSIRRELDDFIQSKLLFPRMATQWCHDLISAVRLLISNDKCEGRFVFGRQVLKPSKKSIVMASHPTLVSRTESGPGGDNSKSQLQTLLTRAGYAAPIYMTKQLKNNQFQATVEFNGMQIMGQPCNNKKSAEKDAAAEALQWLMGGKQTGKEYINHVSMLLKKSKKDHN